jgi:hypothetical protein
MKRIAKLLVSTVAPAGRVRSSVESEGREVEAAFLRVGIVAGNAMLLKELP